MYLLSLLQGIRIMKPWMNLDWILHAQVPLVYMYVSEFHVNQHPINQFNVKKKVAVCHSFYFEWDSLGQPINVQFNK